MMFGTVNNNCEAIIKVAVGRIGSPKVTVDAVIDTGFIAIATLLRTFLVMCFACCQKCPCPNLCGGSYIRLERIDLSLSHLATVVFRLLVQMELSSVRS